MSREAREAAGHPHVADEISVTTDKGKIGADQVFRDLDGKPYGIESKSGQMEKVTANQREYFANVNGGRNQEITDANARDSGFDGQKLDRIKADQWNRNFPIRDK